MSAPVPPERVLHSGVTLYAMLSRNFGSSVGLDAQTGKLSVSCGAEGMVWNTSSGFAGQRCNVSFCIDASDRITEFAREHGLEAACGSIKLTAGLKPEIFESDGEEIAVHPIHIYFVLSESSYAYTERLLRSALRSGNEASLTIRFTHRDFSQSFTQLEEVDLSKTTSYPIVSFSINRAQQENAKVRVPPHEYNPSTIASLTFTAVQVDIQSSHWHSELVVYAISFKGKLQSRSLGFSSDDDTLEVKEYESRNGFQNGYPEESYPGSVYVFKDETGSNCSVTLYATRVVMTQLAAWLAGLAKGDVARFDVSMMATEQPIPIGEHYFNVTGYSPTIYKTLA